MKYLLSIILLLSSLICVSQDTAWIVDDYPVTNQMFKGNYEPKECGGVTYFDKACYSNDSLKQVLMFELYTDYHRIITHHFYYKEIPDSLINSIEKWSKGATDSSRTKQEKLECVAFLVETSKKISSTYFTSNKGLKLGDTKEKCEKIYGYAHKDYTKGDLEILKWFYDPDPNLIEEGLRLEAIYDNYAKDNFGHEVTMFFRDNKLIAVILFKDIP